MEFPFVFPVWRIFEETTVAGIGSVGTALTVLDT
jgi:hypothetical protein